MEKHPQRFRKHSEVIQVLPFVCNESSHLPWLNFYIKSMFFEIKNWIKFIQKGEKRGTIQVGL